MLISEAFSSTYGAWRLLVGDRSGMRFFNPSRVGMFRSFAALVAIFPVNCGLQFLAISNAGWVNQVDWAKYVPAQVIAYVIVCTGFPLLMFYVADMLDRRERFASFLVAYNWSSIVRVGILTPAVVLAYTDVLPDDFEQYFLQVVWIGILVYSGYVARVALNIGVFIAIGIVVGDLIFTELVLEFAAMISPVPNDSAQ